MLDQTILNGIRRLCNRAVLPRTRHAHFPIIMALGSMVLNMSE